MDKQNIASKIRELIKARCQFNQDKLDMDSDLRNNYGIDSIVLVEVLFEIETIFKVAVDDNLLTYDNFNTVQKICDYVYNRLGDDGGVAL